MSAVPSTQGAVRSAEKMIDYIAKNQPYAYLIKEGDPLAAKIMSPSAQGNILKAVDVVKLWRGNGRQTVAMHPAIVNELSIATSTRIPTDVLYALPYINPMVVYADPPVFDSWEKMSGRRSTTPAWAGVGDKMRLLGFFTHGSKYKYEADTGRPAARFFGDTNDPEFQGTGQGNLGVLAVFEVLDDCGNIIDWECNTMTIPYGIVGTLKDMVDDLAKRFYFEASGTADTMPPGAVQWLSTIMNTIVGTLFYLCSTVLEAEKVPTSATAHFRKTIARKPLSLYRIDWTTGAALTRYRSARPAVWKESEQGDIRHQRDPQQRCAHIKVVWTGKGRTVPKIALVGAYWTHRERLGEAGVNTVRRALPDKDTGAGESLDTALSLRP